MTVASAAASAAAEAAAASSIAAAEHAAAEAAAKAASEAAAEAAARAAASSAAKAAEEAAAKAASEAAAKAAEEAAAKAAEAAAVKAAEEAAAKAAEAAAVKAAEGSAVKAAEGSALKNVAIGAAAGGGLLYVMSGGTLFGSSSDSSLGTASGTAGTAGTSDSTSGTSSGSTTEPAGNVQQRADAQQQLTNLTDCKKQYPNNNPPDPSDNSITTTCETLYPEAKTGPVGQSQWWDAYSACFTKAVGLGTLNAQAENTCTIQTQSLIIPTFSCSTVVKYIPGLCSIITWFFNMYYKIKNYIAGIGKYFLYAFYILLILLAIWIISEIISVVKMFTGGGYQNGGAYNDNTVLYAILILLLLLVFFNINSKQTKDLCLCKTCDIIPDNTEDFVSKYTKSNDISNVYEIYAKDIQDSYKQENPKIVIPDTISSNIVNNSDISISNFLQNEPTIANVFDFLTDDKRDKLTHYDDVDTLTKNYYELNDNTNYGYTNFDTFKLT